MFNLCDIYLYEYETEDLIKKATNRVWSKILFDLKQEMKDKIILIPIAADSDLTSLNSPSTHARQA